MTKQLLATVASASLLLSSGALAQSFTYDVVWEPVESVGGIVGPSGPQYGGGSVNGKYVTTYADGTVAEGTVRCVGMDQPDGGIFAIHLTCTTKEEAGTGSLAYGCNFLGERGPETPLGCVGALQGREGEFAGQNGSLTMHWYANDKSTGTGQWYTSQ